MKREYEAIQWPMTMTCAQCGGELRVYPYPAPTGSAFCPTCSPAWLEDFLQFATASTRDDGYRARSERDTR